MGHIHFEIGFTEDYYPVDEKEYGSFVEAVNAVEHHKKSLGRDLKEFCIFKITTKEISPDEVHVMNTVYMLEETGAGIHGKAIDRFESYL